MSRRHALIGFAVALLAVTTVGACAPAVDAPSGGPAAPTSDAASPHAVSAPTATTGASPTAVLSPLPPPPTSSAAPADEAEGGSMDGFVWSVATVTAADLPHSWREGCPVPPDQLRAVTVGYHAMSGGVRTGFLVVNADILTPTRRAFERLFEIGFPITSIRPVDEFGGDDDASMAADNTSGFNCRAAVSNGPTTWSNHAYGRAIDVNPTINPYILEGEVLPPNGAPYTDRDAAVPGMITRGSPALKAFTDNGFTWGGTWSNPDYQHFQR